VDGIQIADGAIANWATTIFTSCPNVIRLPNGTYLLVYGKQSGSDYYIYKRTSSNFTTWSDESVLSIAGLTSTWRLNFPYVLQELGGDLWLWFSALESIGPGGEELTNIYYSISSDSGGTWGTAVKVTDYDTYSEVGGHPVAIQKALNQMHLIFTRKVGALHMTDSASGWPTGDNACELSFDSTNRKLYVINVQNGMGTKYLQNVVRIDIDTWTVDDYWDETTTPGFPSFICGSGATEHVWYETCIHDGHHIVIKCNGIGDRYVWHLNGEDDTITNYYFDSHGAYGTIANVTHSLPSTLYQCNHAQVDIANDRIWLLFEDSLASKHLKIGYLDLTETSDYQFHQIASWTSSDWWLKTVNGMYVDVAGGYIVVTASSTNPVTKGGCLVLDIESGAEIVEWTGDDSDFPYFGLDLPFVYNGRIYAGLSLYTSGYGQSAFRGLCEIDIASETIVTYRPSYCSNDTHHLGRPSLLQDGRIAMTHNGYGVAVFDTIYKTWEVFNNSNISGFTPDGVEFEAGSQVAYDDLNDLVMVGDSYGSWSGVIMFSIHGFMRQSYYSLGSYGGGTWTFATALQLVQGYLDYDAVACTEPDSPSAMYVFWINETADGEKSIKWDKDGSSIDLSDYLTIDEISAQQNISGSPSSLSFTVSHGHLFDPHNKASLLSIVLKKGRKLTLRWGERISGTDYWQNAGTFFVTETSLSFEHGSYPVMKIKAEDQRTLWAESHIYATEIYNNLPDTIISDILTSYAGMVVAEINLPSFVGESLLQMQWIDSHIDDIVTQVCERFGYYFRFDVDGKANAKPISNVNAIDHVYSDNTKLISYSPDDRYSDFTNRVTVQGQELDFTQLIFEEERISQVSGTLGWWGCKKEHKVWFSEDKSRRAVNPRLEVIETSTGIPFQLGGKVKESLDDCEPTDDNKFCTVNVKAPNLIGMLSGCMGLAILGWIPGNYAPPMGGLTISVGRWIERAGVMGCLLILGSSSNYQLEVWAQPLGQARRSCQASWNDLEHQTEINAIVEKVIVDPLSYSAADCLTVATFEGLVAQMQRKRVMIRKTAHLQDEDGDTIQVRHPYSDTTIDVFITDLKRIFKKSTSGSRSNDGGFWDEIEGWVVS
jgi:hypothetical protein